MRRVVIAGASGFIGQRVYRQLCAPATNVSHLYSVGRRSVINPAAAIHQEEYLGKFADLEHWMTQWHADTAICTLGTTIKQAGSQAAFKAVDYDAVLAFARFAQRLGVTHFIVVTAVGAHPNSASFYSRIKGEVEQALKQLGFERLSIIQPSLLLGEREEYRALESLGQIVAKPLSWLMFGPLIHYRPITGDTVAAAIVALVKSPPMAGTHVLQYPALCQLAQQQQGV